MAVLIPAAALGALVTTEALGNLVFALVSQILAAALAPELAGLQAESFRLNQSVPMPAADAVEAFIKGHMTQAQAEDEAALTGISNPRFRILADTAGEPIPLQLAFQAWRRGLIPASSGDPNTPSLEKAIRDSRLKNAWFPTVKALQFELAPVGTIIEGWLRAQITKQDALDLAYKQGVDEATATLMFKAAGRPPSPQELFTLWNRGVIPETGRGGDTLSVEQGYLETDLKDKWLPIWKHLREYRPPPRTITALQRAGSLDDAAALKLYEQEGLTPEMAALYVKTAHHERSATTKELTKAELTALYVDQAITEADYRARLGKLGFAGESADLEVQLADLKVDHALLQRGINRVGTLYTGRRIDKAMAADALLKLKLPAKQRDRLLEIWSVERSDVLKHLTPVEVAQAVNLGFFSPAEGIAKMQEQGWGAHDAYVILAIHKVDLSATPEPAGNLPPP
jgi:hypothetical protein